MKFSKYIILFLLLKAVEGYAQTETRALDKAGLFKEFTFLGKRYFVFEADPHQYKIELFNQLQNNGQPYSFNKIIAEKGKSLVFAMNGGMFEKDLKPVGLYIADGKTYNPVNTRQDEGGNFYQLKPNGVFFIDGNDNASVLTTENYVKANLNIKLATQSGPMLLINDAINSNFKEGSQNLNIRNGVGVNKKGNAVFVISVDPVNFYEFARLFKEKLECQNALYLDGVVSQYFAPALEKTPVQGAQLGVFLVVSIHGVQKRYHRTLH